MPDTAATIDSPIQLTASAARRIAELITQEGNAALMFRVAISGGGCNGFQTGFSLDDRIGDDDRIYEDQGVKVVLDAMSADLVRGSRLDFVDELIGSYFSLDNPNAKSTCGCGSSFSV